MTAFKFAPGNLFSGTALYKINLFVINVGLSRICPPLQKKTSNFYYENNVKYMM